MGRVLSPLTLSAWLLPILLSESPFAWGWGDEGHHVVALIAEQRLTPDARNAVIDLLDGESFVTASTWADREWMVRKTALETGAENWLALARYLTLQKRYDQARAVYQRILDSYTADAERPYRERAARAKQDLDILSPPASTRQ